MTGRGWLILLLGVLCGIIGSMIWDFFMGFARYMKMKKAKEELMVCMKSGKPFALREDEDGNMIFSFMDKEENYNGKNGVDCATNNMDGEDGSAEGEEKNHESADEDGVHRS